MDSIKTAISTVGTASKLAALLGVTPQAVCFWRDGLRVFPAHLAPTVERLTQGKVRCEELRPDVDWAYLRATDCPNAEFAGVERCAAKAPCG